MNLKELADLADRLEGIEARYKALETAILENGAAMAEILEMLSKQGPDTAAAIADALKGIKFTLPPMPEAKPAQVNVTVPEIRMPEIRLPEPAKTNDWTTLKVSIPQPTGPARVMTITKDK